MFKADPVPTTQILEILNADSSLYVRRSVANHLNDLSKDHPNYVLSLAREWQGKDERTDWIIRHGCRTMLRRAMPEAFLLFGYYGEVADAVISTEPSYVAIGEDVAIHFGFRVAKEAKLRVEYAIDFVKANGKTSQKKFLLTDTSFQAGKTIERQRTHSFKDLSTRKHYSGLHRIVLIVNGVDVAESAVNISEAPKD